MRSKCTLTISFNCPHLFAVEKVLERGEKIDVLVGKTEELDHSVSWFYLQAHMCALICA